MKWTIRPPRWKLSHAGTSMASGRWLWFGARMNGSRSTPIASRPCNSRTCRWNTVITVRTIHRVLRWPSRWGRGRRQISATEGMPGRTSPWVFRFIASQIVRSTFAAARTVASMSSGVCAVEMNPASNCDGAR